jgi:hypothetical protein
MQDLIIAITCLDATKSGNSSAIFFFNNHISMIDRYHTSRSCKLECRIPFAKFVQTGFEKLIVASDVQERAEISHGIEICGVQLHLQNLKINNGTQSGWNVSFDAVAAQVSAQHKRKLVLSGQIEVSVWVRKMVVT